MKEKAEKKKKRGYKSPEIKEVWDEGVEIDLFYYIV